jgi:hypothetical protein
MKNKDNQRLLQFPSVFNLEPGGKSEVKPVEDPAAPEWKKEVSKKVEEHRKMKELQESLQGLKSLAREPLPPQELEQEKARLEKRFPSPTPEAAAPPLLREGLQDEKLREKLQFPQKSAPSPAAAGAKEADLKEKLADTHRQLFRDADVTLEEELRAIEAQPPPPAFDELSLARNPLPSASPWADEEITLAPEPPAGGNKDLGMPLGELLARQQKQSKTILAATNSDRTVLVSRVLAGLIDLLVVLAMSLVLLFMVSFSTQQVFFSRPMGILLAALLLLNQFIYSFYFLFLWRRTLGMGLVGLEVRFQDDSRPAPGTILLRITFYILAIACLGIGLFWGIFDREAKCWQDILSDSHIARVA